MISSSENIPVSNRHIFCLALVSFNTVLLNLGDVKISKVVIRAELKQSNKAFLTVVTRVCTSQVTDYGGVGTPDIFIFTDTPWIHSLWLE